MSRKSRKITLTDSASDQTEIKIWPEWSDVDLNLEPWDFPKGGFLDPHQIILPESLKPAQWKRFAELNSVDSPVIHGNVSGYPDLVSKNRHILHSEFIRCFVSTLINLQYCGRHGLEIENPTANFSWNHGNECWKGWFYVYSLNKAGKEIAHRPIFNSNGRYVVRIFHMGRWRKILVDDLVPIDSEGRSLLPRTSNLNEIWPIILAKALLKVAALSSMEKREIADCSLIVCLTGWIGLSLDVSHLSSKDQWDLIVRYTKRFEWPSQNVDQLMEQVQLGTDDNNNKSTRVIGRKSNNKSKSLKSEVVEADDKRSTFCFLNIVDETNNRDVDYSNDIIPGITAHCWIMSHEIYVEMSRDVPLDPKRMKAGIIAEWKNIRWLDWAIHSGLISAADYLVPVRRLLVVSSPLGIIKSTIVTADDDLDKDLGGARCPSEISYSRDHLFDNIKMENNKYSSISSEPLAAVAENLDIGVWSDFNKLSDKLWKINLFYRLTYFKYSIEISDCLLSKRNSNNGEKKRKTEVSAKEYKKMSTGRVSEQGASSEKMHHHRENNDEEMSNENLYLFVDSEDWKLFLVDLSTFSEVNSRKMSVIVIERCNYFARASYSSSNDDEEPLLILKTRGTRSMVFQIEPGRHLLRIIYKKSTSNYRALLLSNTPFEIGNLEKMHKLMSKEACRIENFARNVGNCVKKACESFGTADYWKELNNYRESYRPDRLSVEDEAIIKSIDDLFIEQVIVLAQKKLDSISFAEANRALRIFFLDSSLGRRKLRVLAADENEEKKNIGRKEQLDGSAFIIQSFFRLILKKSYEKMHDSSHRDHERIKESLRRVCEILSSHENNKEDAGISDIMRKIIKMKNVGKYYSWIRDTSYVIDIQEFCGKTTYRGKDNWTPIAIIKLNVKNEPILGVVSFFCSPLSDRSITIFDNDNNREVVRVTGDIVIPSVYQPTVSGCYTLFACGSNYLIDQIIMDWSIHVTTIKGEPSFCLIDQTDFIPPAKIDTIMINPLIVNEIHGIYMPNYQHNIFKLIIKIKKNILIWLRLRTSYDKVLTLLSVIDPGEEGNKVLSEIEGGSITTMPLVSLRLDDANINSSSNNNNKEFIIEAVIRNNSWPLDENEWALVLASKMNQQQAHQSFQSSSAIMRQARKSAFNAMSSDELMTEPYWYLLIISESHHNNSHDAPADFEIIRRDTDPRREENIYKLIHTSEQSEQQLSGRLERGKKLRRYFIDNYSSSSSSPHHSNHTIETINDESTINKNKKQRTHEPPPNLSHYLPKLDLGVFMEKEDEEEYRWIKTEFDEETLRNQRAINVFDFQHFHHYFLQESSRFLQMRRKAYYQAELKYLVNRNNRNEAIYRVYQARKLYVDSTKDTTTTARSLLKSKEASKPKKINR